MSSPSPLKRDPSAVISLISFVLGGGFFLSLSLALPLFLPFLPTTITWPNPTLPAYVAFWCLFHTLEYLVTAVWNPTKVYWGSFLLSNGKGYNIASFLVLVEYALEAYFFPGMKTVRWWTYLGLGLILVGQFLRTLAMVQASTSFSHHVAFKKKDDHVLVKSGLYAYVRHPSYMAFWWWAVGTQLLTSNPIMGVLFAVFLWRWFFNRIREEEFLLVRFFGQDYIEYRKKVVSGLPLLR